MLLLCVLRFVVGLHRRCLLELMRNPAPSVKSAKTEVMTPDPPVSLPPQEVAAANTG